MIMSPVDRFMYTKRDSQLAVWKEEARKQHFWSVEVIRRRLDSVGLVTPRSGWAYTDNSKKGGVGAPWVSKRQIRTRQTHSTKDD